MHLDNLTFVMVQFQVVLQKLVEDRKFPGKGIDQEATPKISAMNLTRSRTAPLLTFLTCPFFNMFIISYPFIVRLAVLNDPNPILSLTNRFMPRWSCKGYII